MKSVVILRSNPVDPDPRVEKEARALCHAGWNVLIVGWDRTGGLASWVKKPYGKIVRLFIPARFGSGMRNLPHLLRWEMKLFYWLWKNRRTYTHIHACDFDTVLPALIIKWLFRKKVVYDIFDFYADMLRKTPSVARNLVRKVDIWAIGHVDAVILADQRRIKQIAGARPVKIEIIYNAPEPVSVLKQRVKRESFFRIAYVGQLHIERGLLEIFDIVEEHKDWFLDLAGFGGDEHLIISRASELPNVRFYGRVDYETALSINAHADVLFATYDPSVPNHRYSSANKLFEAMMLGKPIIVAKGTGMDEIVTKYGTGFVVEYGDKIELERVLSFLASWTEEERKEFKIKCRTIYDDEFSWGQMTRRLTTLYATL